MNVRKFLFNGKTLTLVLLALAVAGYVWYRSGQPAQAESAFLTENVDRGDIVQTVSANGTLNPLTLVSVGTQVSGTVRKLHADFNQQVQKGQVLLELDDAIYAAAVRQSEASVRNQQAALDLARANEARMQILYAQEYVSRLELEQTLQERKSSEAQVDQARAQLARDRANLNYSVIRSPVSGVVVARQVDLGQTVAASFQTPELFKIAQDLSRMQIHSSFAEADVGQIRVGQHAQFSVDAYSSRQFQAVVQQIRLNPTVQQNVVTYDIVLDVDNPEHILLPGMTAYVSVTLSEQKDVLRVPNAALRYRPTEQDGERNGKLRRDKNTSTRNVYVLRNGKPEAVAIEPGITDSRYTAVLSAALQPGEPLVVGDALAASAKDSGRGVRMRLF
jgi:HlyD family secretion protein